MKALEAADERYITIRNREKPTYSSYWHKHEEDTCICIGWNGNGDNDKDYEIGISDRGYFERYNATILTYKEAMNNPTKAEVEKVIHTICAHCNGELEKPVIGEECEYMICNKCYEFAEVANNF